jgi:hypothetical protein
MCLSVHLILAFTTVPTSKHSRDSSVGKALGYGMDDQGSRDRFPGGGGGGEFLFSPPRP